MLTDEQVGRLFRALIKYSKSGEPPDEYEDIAVRMIFSVMASSIDENNRKYEEICEKRRQAGKNGGAPKGNTNAKQAKTNKTSKNKQTEAKQPDTDTDTDTDTDYYILTDIINTECLNIINTNSASEPAKPAKKTAAEVAPDWFEGIWKQYPAKRGKGDIKKTHYAELAKAGEERVQRALDNYLAELRRNEWQHPMHGSRFFKCAWRDYDRESEQPQREPTMQEIIEQMRRESEQSGN